MAIPIPIKMATGSLHLYPTSRNLQCFYKSFYNVNLDNWCSACFLFLEHDINGRAYGSRLNAMSMIKNKQSRNVIARVFFSQLKFSTY